MGWLTTVGLVTATGGAGGALSGRLEEVLTTLGLVCDWAKPETVLHSNKAHKTRVTLRLLFLKGKLELLCFICVLDFAAAGRTGIDPITIKYQKH